MNQTPGRRRDWMQWGFVGPALLLLIAMNVFPLIYSILLSFTNADLVGGEWKFIGGLNYKFVFKFAKYGQALRTSALFVFSAVAIELFVGFALALALANPGPRDPMVHAAMCGGVGGSHAAASLIAALAVGAGQSGGAREVLRYAEVSE